MRERAGVEADWPWLGGQSTGGAAWGRLRQVRREERGRGDEGHGVWWEGVVGVRGLGERAHCGWVCWLRKRVGEDEVRADEGCCSNADQPQRRLEEIILPEFLWGSGQRRCEGLPCCLALSWDSIAQGLKGHL